MIQKRADPVIKLRADDVLELAGVRVRFGIGHGKCVREKPLGQPVAANHIARALLSALREMNLPGAQLDELQVRHAAQHADGVSFFWRAHALDVRGSAFFRANPNLFEQMIEAHLIFLRKNSDLREAAVRQFNSTVGETADGGIMRDDKDGMSRRVQLAKNI